MSGFTLLIGVLFCEEIKNCLGFCSFNLTGLTSLHECFLLLIFSTKSRFCCIFVFVYFLCSNTTYNCKYHKIPFFACNL